jgi:AMP deaminase
MDSSGSASASSYKLQLALAALVGASAAASAAYYLHCRAVAQVARSASTSRRRPRAPASAASGGSGGVKLPPPRRAAVGSASLPDLSAFYDVGSRGGGGLAAGGYLVEEEEDDDADGVVGPHVNGGALDPAEFLQIPQGLPRLHVGPDGMFLFPIYGHVRVCAVGVGAEYCSVRWIGLGKACSERGGLYR